VHVFPEGDKVHLLGVAFSPQRAFDAKIDLFMRLHVLPRFAPENICWWLSLSGGKDSFAMAIGLRKWYRDRNLPFDAMPFTIDQWNGSASRSIQQQIDWASVTIIDGHQLTKEKTRYVPGQQAPCRACADVRRSLSDTFISAVLGEGQSRSRRNNILARGLHLTDTSVSAMWRFAVGKDPAKDLAAAGKAKPITPLFDSVFLAKPLYYVREFESQGYAQSNGYKRTCCGCPACQFPSRRDIVEESIIAAVRSPLWEFNVPGIEQLLHRDATGTSLGQIRAMSASGEESKHAHLPMEFAEFMVSKFQGQWNRVNHRFRPRLDHSIDLDAVGLSRLRQGAPLVEYETIPLPGLFREEQLPDAQLMMIATLGPFWGAIGLGPRAADRAWRLQEQLFGFSVDERWSQVAPMLREFYSVPEPQASLVQIQ